MEVTFQTQTLPIETFEASLQDACGNFDVRPTQGDADMWGGISLRRQMDLEFALVATDLQQILRTSQNIRQDDGENFFLIMQKEGRALMGQNDRFSVLHPGDLVLIDSAKPSEFTFFGDRSIQMSLHLPRVDLEERFGAVIPGGLSVNRQDPTAMAIHAIIAKSESTGDAQVHLKDALLSLIGVALMERRIHGETTTARLEQREGSVLTRSIGYIEMRFQDPEFTPAMIAPDLGVQPYQVQRAFKSLGTTATKYLLAKRLETARTRLIENAKSHHPVLVSTIAYQSGFADVSYFNRCFRKVFGKTPSDMG